MLSSEMIEIIESLKGMIEHDQLMKQFDKHELLRAKRH